MLILRVVRVLYRLQVRTLLDLLNLPMLLTIVGKDIPFWSHLCIFTYFIIIQKSYDTFDSLIEQFTNAVQERKRGISRENFDEFFKLCRRHYSSIEKIVKNDLVALKILVRMMSVLPVNQENMTIASEAAQLFVSIVLRILSSEFDAVSIAITDPEWPSFREGLITSLCIKLHRQTLDKDGENVLDLLTYIPEGTRRQDVAQRLIDLLSKLSCNLLTHQEAILYTLIGPKNLTLEHLELSSSLEMYINYLTKLMIAYEGDDSELEAKIQVRLNKLLLENHFPSKS